ncbi:hypothetical protein EO763_23105 (plasmid) [Pectobacterium odoriferum]|uniref:hypothetical protein n=1 Tax=Pectobacterium odoriferum TaxID=78398 RepID=UPI001373A38E|nr:hypothetical protein [Pectobacterium odoriferum]QHP82785.1 hypothetical protein EO763_23105 [Pectobacterium odoriferum]
MMKSDTDIMNVLYLLGLPLFTTAGLLSGTFSLISLPLGCFVLYDGGNEGGAALILGLVFAVICYWCYTNLRYVVHQLRQPA